MDCLNNCPSIKENLADWICTGDFRYGSLARVIRPSVWTVPLASPLSLDASGETDLR